MQAAGQYGVPEVPQYGITQGHSPHAHIFNLSHEVSHLHQQTHLLHAQQHHAPSHHQNHPPPQDTHLHPHHQHAQSQHFQQTQPQSQSLSRQQQQQYEHNQQSQQQPQIQQLENPSSIAHANKSIGEQSSDTAEDHDGLAEDERGTSGNRWPSQETLALLKIRAEMDATFRDSSVKGPLWEDVSRKMAEMGYHRNPKKCKEKFENVHKYYKRTKDGKSGRQDGKNYRFYSQLEALYAGVSDISSNICAAITPNNLNSNVSGIGSGYTSPRGDRTGVLLARASAVAAVGQVDASGLAHRSELDYSSGLNFSSDSSDDEYEGLTEGDIPERRKRKRKSGRKFMRFFESIMKTILDKQEQMQQKFIEALEQREHDRMLREEAWKRQEMARMAREHELRAQESAIAAARDAALVTFLQKLTGQTLQLPQIAVPVQQHVVTAADFNEDHHSQEKDQFFDPNGKRWPKPEVMALIKLRTGLDTKFHEPGPKSQLWEEISARMSSLGFNRNAKRCKEKWENINKYFKKAKESNKKRPENSKTCPYFHELDALYSKGLLGQKQLMHKADDNSEELLEQLSDSNREEDSGGKAQGDSHMLAIMSSAQNAKNGGKTGDNGNMADLELSKPSNLQNIFESNSITGHPPPIVIPQSFEGAGILSRTLSSNSKPTNQEEKEGVKMDHLQSSVEDYNKVGMEVDDRTQKQQQQLQYDENGSSTTFMALVQKLRRDPSDYAIPESAAH